MIASAAKGGGTKIIETFALVFFTASSPELNRKILENIARHRTADIRAETQGRKRDIIGRIERSIFEPLCYIVGKVKLQWRNKW